MNIVYEVVNLKDMALYKFDDYSQATLQYIALDAAYYYTRRPTVQSGLFVGHRSERCKKAKPIEMR